MSHTHETSSCYLQILFKLYVAAQKAEKRFVMLRVKSSASAHPKPSKGFFSYYGAQKGTIVHRTGIAFALRSARMHSKRQC